MVKQKKRTLRKNRIRRKVSGTQDRPRAVVFRSLKHIYVQFVDDENGVTLLSFDDRKLLEKDQKGKTKEEKARLVGKEAGVRAQKKGITTVAFDRGGFRYHGRVKAVAEGLRESGVEF